MIRRLGCFVIIIFFSVIHCYGQHENSITIWVMDRNVHTNISMSTLSIKEYSGTDSIQIIDTVTVNYFYRLLSDSIHWNFRKDFSKIDVRLLIQFGNERKLAFSKFDIISLDDLIYEFEISKFIQVLRRYIPPDLHWYEATEEEIKRYQKIRLDRYLESITVKTKKN